MVGIGKIVRASDLDWTIVRVPLLTDAPGTERTNVRHVGNDGDIRLSGANAAAYFLQQPEDTTRVDQPAHHGHMRRPAERGHGIVATEILRGQVR